MLAAGHLQEGEEDALAEGGEGGGEDEGGGGGEGGLEGRERWLLVGGVGGLGGEGARAGG